MSRSQLTPGIKIISYDAQASDTANDYWWATGNFHVKPSTPDHLWLVANEFIASRLAAAIGLPVPAGDVGVDPDGRTAWITAVVGLEGEPPAPEDPAMVLTREPDVAAGMFVFDVWLLNGDRHEENVISHPSLGVYAIDHDQALGGDRTGVPGCLDNLQTNPITYHAFRELPLPATRLHDWGSRVRGVSKTAVERLVAEGGRRGLYPKATADAVANFILRRQGDIHRLVKRSLPAAQAGAEDIVEVGEAQRVEGGESA